MKYYKAVKDGVDFKKGDIFSNKDNPVFYTKISNNERLNIDVSYHKTNVEDNPEWFEEVWECDECNKFYSWKFIQGDNCCIKCNDKQPEKIKPI